MLKLLIVKRVLQFTFLNISAGIKYFFGTMAYGDEWRKHRRVFQQYFSKNLVLAQERGLEFVRGALLPNFYADPSHFHEHLRRLAIMIVTL